MKNDVINLISVTTTQDTDGFEAKTEVSFPVMADVQSTKRTEYYQAANVGISVQLVAVVNYEDYSIAKSTNGTPKFVLCDGVKYKIARTYRKGKSNDISLTLAEVE